MALMQILNDNKIWRMRLDKTYYISYGRSHLMALPPFKDQGPRMMERSALLKKWQAPYILHPLWTDITPSGINYIVYPYLPTLLESHPMKVLPSWMTDEQIKNILITFCLFHIGRCGDVGPENIWVNDTTHEIFIMDYDEVTITPNFTNTFYFKKEASKQFLKEWTNRITDLWADVFKSLQYDHLKQEKKDALDDLRKRIQLRI
jgi:hypothetical protein